MEKLSDEQIEEALEDLAGWEYDGEVITKTYPLGSFREAIEFVNDIADVAEESNHHPDLEIYFDEVVVSFRTHSEDAVTTNDVEMAKEVESLVVEDDEDYDELDDDDLDEDDDELDEGPGDGDEP